MADCPHSGHFYGLNPKLFQRTILVDLKKTLNQDFDLMDCSCQGSDDASVFYVVAFYVSSRIKRRPPCEHSRGTSWLTDFHKWQLQRKQAVKNRIKESKANTRSTL